MGSILRKGMSLFPHREGFRQGLCLGLLFNEAPTVKVKFLLQFVGLWSSTGENIT